MKFTFLISLCVCGFLFPGCRNRSSSLKSNNDGPAQTIFIPGALTTSQFNPKNGIGFDSRQGSIVNKGACVVFTEKILTDEDGKKWFSRSEAQNSSDGIDKPIDNPKGLSGIIVGKSGFLMNANSKAVGRSLDGNLKGTYQAANFTFKGDLEYNDSHSSDEFSSTSTLYGNYVLGVLQLDSGTQILTPFGEQVAAIAKSRKNQNGFSALDYVRSECGDYLVSQVAYGLQFLATAKVRAQTKKDAMRIAANLSYQGTVGAGKLDVSGGATIGDQKIRSSMSVEFKVEQIGGDPARSNVIYGDNLRDCAGLDLEACKKMMTNAISYFEKDLVDQIYKDEERKVHNISRLATLGAIATPISDVLMRKLSGTDEVAIPCTDRICQASIEIVNESLEGISDIISELRAMSERANILKGNASSIGLGLEQIKSIDAELQKVKTLRAFAKNKLLECLKTPTPEFCQTKRQETYDKKLELDVNPSVFVFMPYDFKGFCEMQKLGTEGLLDQDMINTWSPFLKAAGQPRDVSCTEFNSRMSTGLQSLKFAKEDGTDITGFYPVQILNNGLRSLSFDNVGHFEGTGKSASQVGFTAGEDLKWPTINILSISRAPSRLEFFSSIPGLTDLFLTELGITSPVERFSRYKSLIKLKLNNSQLFSETKGDRLVRNSQICSIVSKLVNIKTISLSNMSFDFSTWDEDCGAVEPRQKKLDSIIFSNSLIEGGEENSFKEKFDVWCSKVSKRCKYL